MRPKMGYSTLQQRLIELLRSRAEHKGVVAAEVPFRALPEHELRAADVAFVSYERWAGSDDEDDLHGSPELVIEIVSRSNTSAEMREKATFSLSTGAEEFWAVDPKGKSVSVTRREGGTAFYEMGERITLTLFGGELAVAQIFEGS